MERLVMERPGRHSIVRGVALATLFLLASPACGRGEETSAKKGQAGAGGGAMGGSGGTSGASSSGGSAGADLAVASVLDGLVITQPCVESSGPRSCRTHPAGPCPVSSEAMFEGARPTDEKLSFGGKPGTLYDVLLHVQGIVEPKVYEGGSDASPLVTNGFLRAGRVDNQKSQHSTFALRVTAPDELYFWNSLGRENIRHSVFAVDYEATITVQGGSELGVWVSDPNCQALKNCGDPEVLTECVPVTLPNLEPKIREKLGAEPQNYDGQFLGFVVKEVAARN